MRRYGLHRALNGLEDAIPRGRTTLAEVFGLEAATGGVGPSLGVQLKAWEFTGMAPLVAAKHYLRKMGEPRSFEDIVRAIREHGGNPGSPDHLKTALTRSTFDVVKVSDEMYGPIEAFPHIKRSSSKKRKTFPLNVLADPDDSEMEPEQEGEEGGEGDGLDL